MTETLSAPAVTVIRLAEAADAGEILTVQRAAYLAEAQLYRDPFLPPLTEPLAEVAEDIAQGRVLVAVQGHRVAGTVRLKVHEGTGHIGRLAVAPDLHGRGIGTSLLRAAESAAPADVTRFELFTGTKSERNVLLYQRLGYRECDRRRLSDTVELVFLERLLTGYRSGSDTAGG